ncbi:hypothetical protein AQI88_17765 [Streptomyces cellostaticus]|uniref:Uncharacterized protein n=1 Tax=Streptomyces cellostaticus TaxID=67285 RepID=A0A117PW40_9ACTN|nr:hypothetical protein [Streptomyces cellostaticus]KUM95238.1 hypothetical protein AQI88_17765 [Streptomyces cellostaticus]
MAVLTLGVWAPSAAASPTPPAEYAPSATLSVAAGAPGQEVEALWLDEWRDEGEKAVKVTSPAFEAPATLTFTGRQYEGKVHLRRDAQPGQAQARVITHRGQAVKKTVFWIESAKPTDEGSNPLVWLGVGALAAVGAGTAGAWAMRRRRRLSTR